MKTILSIYLLDNEYTLPMKSMESSNSMPNAMTHIMDGFLDKVLSITENGDQIHSYEYWTNGQLADATHMASLARMGGMATLAGASEGSVAPSLSRQRERAGVRGGSLAEGSAAIREETFLWDGLALLRRNETQYMNEPHVTGGNPIVVAGNPMLEDMLGNTIGAITPNGNFAETNRTAFGDAADTDADLPTDSPADPNTDFFTGKPNVDGLGYAFLFRNYRQDQGKWGTSDPLGYLDGWNNLQYCENSILDRIDYFGTYWVLVSGTEPTNGRVELISEERGMINGPGLLPDGTEYPHPVSGPYVRYHYHQLRYRYVGIISSTRSFTGDPSSGDTITEIREWVAEILEWDVMTVNYDAGSAGYGFEGNHTYTGPDRLVSSTTSRRTFIWRWVE